MTKLDPETSTIFSLIVGNLRETTADFLRGFCMGAADSVPGVSGGTVALILGHYHQLVTAISHFDRKALKLLIDRQWRDLATHIDLRFLITLGAGVVTAIVTLASLLIWLLENRLPQTLAVFMGLIVASVWIVGRQIESWNVNAILALVGGTVVGYGVSSMTPLGLEPTHGFLFLSAVAAITAMILPGISGSFLLLMLGVYHHVIGLIKALPKLSIDLFIFAGGCAIGLMSFTRVLRWLLDHHKNTTFAALLGLMIGSIKRVWPLQQPTVETAAEKFSHQVLKFVPISEWQSALWPLGALAGFAFAFVVTVEWFANQSNSEGEENDPESV